MDGARESRASESENRSSWSQVTANRCHKGCSPVKRSFDGGRPKFGKLKLALIVVAGFSVLLSGCSSGPGANLPLPSLGFLCKPSLAVPDVVPLGSISAAHWHTMEANGEASDFVLYRNEFLEGSPQLGPFGRDHIMEIAARMPTTPFPVLIERSENNTNPQLDEMRRNTVVQLLSQFGVHDAHQRTVVSQPYTDGVSADRATEQIKSGVTAIGLPGGH